MAKSNARTFTDEFLQGLKSSDNGRIEIADKECRGLVVRVNKNNTKSFNAIFRVLGDGGVTPKGKLLRGKQQRITLGIYPEISIDDARQETLLIRSKASKGLDPRQEMRENNLLRNSNSVEAVAKEFIDKYAKTHTVAWKNAERAYNNYVIPFIGRRPIDSITRSDVHKLLDKIVGDGKAGTAREVKKHLCTLFNWAINREICKHNPVLNLTRKDLKPNENAGRALQDDEIKAVWRAAERLEYPFGPLFQLLLLTGQRKSEWANARLDEIDLNEGCLEIPRARYKGRRDHIVPFSVTVTDILTSLPEWSFKNYYLFSTKGGRIPVSGFAQAKKRMDNYVIEELCKLCDTKAVKLKPYRLHDFRVTCETRLANLGFNQEIRDRVLGHAAPGLQKTYNKYDYTAEKKEALQQYAKHIMEIVNEQKTA